VFINNPNGSEILDKPIKVKKLSKNIFKHKNIIFLNFTKDEIFLNSKPHLDIIPNWFINRQESFVSVLSDNQLIQEGTYKITAYTSDGQCSNTLEVNSDFSIKLIEEDHKNKQRKSPHIFAK
jgi:hypothetical protein